MTFVSHLFFIFKIMKKKYSIELCLLSNTSGYEIITEEINYFLYVSSTIDCGKLILIMSEKRSKLLIKTAVRTNLNFIRAFLQEI